MKESDSVKVLYRTTLLLITVFSFQDHLEWLGLLKS